MRSGIILKPHSNHTQTILRTPRRPELIEEQKRAEEEEKEERDEAVEKERAKKSLLGAHIAKDTLANGEKIYLGKFYISS